MSVIRNFKMGLYLKLSTRLQGKWLAVTVLLLASIISVVSSTYCHHTANGQKCFQQNFLRTCQERKELKINMEHLFYAKKTPKMHGGGGTSVDFI